MSRRRHAKFLSAIFKLILLLVSCFFPRRVGPVPGPVRPVEMQAEEQAIRQLREKLAVSPTWDSQCDDLASAALGAMFRAGRSRKEATACLAALGLSQAGIADIMNSLPTETV
jgi:hypothetical protein